MTFSVSPTANSIRKNFASPFSPEDLRYLNEMRQNSSQTPNWVISFGDDIKIENAIADQANSVYLWQYRIGFETPVLGLVSQKLHRSGATTATPCWFIIVNSPLSAQLLAFLHRGSIKTITMSNLSYINQSGAPVVVEKKEFFSCLMVSLIDDSSDFLQAAFLFNAIKTTYPYINASGEGGNNNQVGQAVYEFSYGTGKGTLTA